MSAPQSPRRPKKTRWQNAKDYTRDEHLRQILMGIALVCVGVLLGYFFFAEPTIHDEYNLGLFTGFLGIIVTVFILDRLSERRAIAQEKQMLIAQLGSPSSIITRQAIKVLWVRQWLQDGSVAGANLWEADLENADLGQCDLKDVEFKRANLRGARLWAQLQGASLVDADLRDAKLVDPYHAERRATFSADTILPDKSNYDMSKGFEQLDRFINPTKTDVPFQSSDSRSPVYDGKSDSAAPLN